MLEQITRSRLGAWAAHSRVEDTMEKRYGAFNVAKVLKLDELGRSLEIRLSVGLFSLQEHDDSVRITSSSLP